MPDVQIATDGSGTTKGPGGWAAVLRRGDQVREISGSVPEATSNSMEITAAIMALRELKRPCDVEITTDSEYLLNGATTGLPKWKRNGWRTYSGDPVKNRDLWEELDRLISLHSVSWQWVKGHSGHEDNERCDVLAGEVRAALLPPKPEKAKRAKKPFSLDGIPVAAFRDAFALLPDAQRAAIREALA